MLPQKVNYGSVKRLGGFDVDSMPGVGPDYPKSRVLRIYYNPSCPLEIVVAAETVGHYKEGHF